MAFITNQNKDGATTLAKRLAELISHADQLDMLVGFFYFSGVKVLAEALRDRPQMKMRVLVGMDAEFALGQLVEVVQKGGADSNAVPAKISKKAHKQSRPQCEATTLSGNRCKRHAVEGAKYCSQHAAILRKREKDNGNDAADFPR